MGVTVSSYRADVACEAAELAQSLASLKDRVPVPERPAQNRQISR
jgi:hypothetical protein